MSASDLFRARAREHAVKAKLAKDRDEWLSHKQMAKSYLLLSKSAEWLNSTDGFIAALKSGERLQGPAAPSEPLSGQAKSSTAD